MFRVNKAMRILSVVLAVVIVSVGLCQPVQASAIAAGTALVLLVAALLTACGLTFASQAQLDAAANYAVSVMPSDLKTELNNALGGSVPPGPGLIPYILSGVAAVVTLTPSLFNRVKAWLNEIFGVNEETVAAGSVEAPVTTVKQDENVDLMTVTDSAGNNIYYYDFGVYSGSKGLAYQKMNYSFPATYYFSKYTVTYCVYQNVLYKKTKYTDGNEIEESISRVYYPEMARFGLVKVYDTSKGEYGLCVAFEEESTRWVSLSYNYQGATDSRKIFIPMSMFGNEKYGINSDAYNYTPSDVAESVPIAIVENTETLLTKDYKGVINDYNSNDYDWAAAVEIIKGQLESVKAQLAALGSDALTSDSDKLEKELAALHALLAKQGVKNKDQIDELNDALYDAYTAINTLTDALGKNKADTEEQILALTAALAQSQAQVQELVDALTNTGEVVVPDVPSIEEGSINWSILMNIAIFDKFPFCLPKDVYTFFSMLAAPPKEPVFVFDIFAGKFGKDATITLDFNKFDDVRILVRNGIFILLVVGLIGASKTYIWSGGG